MKTKRFEKWKFSLNNSSHLVSCHQESYVSSCWMFNKFDFTKQNEKQHCSIK